MRGPARTLPAVLLLCLGTAAAPPALAADAVGAAASRDEQVRGREQLVRAIDAAWIRVTASGKDREIRRTLPAHAPGAAGPEEYHKDLAGITAVSLMISAVTVSFEF